MAFDPDAFLATRGVSAGTQSTRTSFDPDAFLSTRGLGGFAAQPSTPPAPSIGGFEPAPQDPRAMLEEQVRGQGEQRAGMDKEARRQKVGKLRAKYIDYSEIWDFLDELEQDEELDYYDLEKEFLYAVAQVKRQKEEEKQQVKFAEKAAKDEERRYEKFAREQAAQQEKAAQNAFKAQERASQQEVKREDDLAKAALKADTDIERELIKYERAQPSRQARGARRPEPTSQLEAAGITMARQAVPTAGAIGGAKVGALAGTAVAPGVGTIIGGIVGGFGGAFLANKAQDVVIEAVKGKEGLNKLNAQMAANVQEYPMTTLGAEIAPSLVAFRVDITKLRKAVTASRTLLSGGKLSGEDVANLADVTLGGGTEAAAEAVAQYNTGDFDAMRLAAATLAGLAINDSRFKKAPPSIKSAVDAQLKQLGDTPVAAAENAASQLQKKGYFCGKTSCCSRANTSGPRAGRARAPARTGPPARACAPRANPRGCSSASTRRNCQAGSSHSGRRTACARTDRIPCSAARTRAG
jgi:hypothetical protein